MLTNTINTIGRLLGAAVYTIILSIIGYTIIVAIGVFAVVAIPLTCIGHAITFFNETKGK